MQLRTIFAGYVLCSLAAWAVQNTNAPAPAFSWQKPHARVLPTGDLAWAPTPYVFAPGPVTRYIDFQNGNDTNDGRTPRTPWQHHPWDRKAYGNAAACSGPVTYVFKGGVAYRGKLMANESGAPGNPIRLVSDPAWGAGPALIVGSSTITGGWKRCDAADAPGMPAPDKLWYIDLPGDFDTDPPTARLSTLWAVRKGTAVRLNIARDPNWTITDPNDPFTQWHRWDAFLGTRNRGWLIDAQWKGKPKTLFQDAVIWTQHRYLMGTPHQINIKEFDPERGAFLIASPGGISYRLGGDPQKPYPLDNRVAYFIENVPAFLDAPGEYYYDRNGPHPGRLYVRAPGDADPNRLTFEAGVTRSPIEIRDRNHIEIAGLQFSFNDDDDGTYGYPWYVGGGAMVRILGTCRDIAVHHCRFYDVVSAVIAFPRPGGTDVAAKMRARDIGPFANDRMDDIRVCDNDVRNSSYEGAIWIQGESGDASGKGYGILKRVEVLRNRVVNSGFRPGRSSTSALQAIRVIIPETAELAGNVVDGSWGSGIFVLGGKSSGARNDVPLTRILVHHNKADNTMLGCNDYGGIEIFQGGPAYFFNNVSRNSVGTKTFTGSELAYNLYLDGAFKIYCFNNILAGRLDAVNSNYYGHCGYFMVFGFLNNFWNNTVYHFEYGVNGSSGNRSAIVGNCFVDAQKSFLGQNRPGDVSMMGGGDTGEQGRKGIPTMAYGDNVFWGHPRGGYRGKGDFGFVGGISTDKGSGAQVYAGNTLEQLRTALQNMHARVSSIGTHTATMPLRNPAAGDYRPTHDSAAIDQGVKFFVPWGLARVVGEWHFYRSDFTPTLVLGEHFYMQEEHMLRDMYYLIPRNDLRLNEAAPHDYVRGPLEDWIDGALQFDGTNRYAVLTHAEMTVDMDYTGADSRRRRGPVIAEGGRFPGVKRRTLDMDTNNFLIEVYFKTAKDHTGGTIVEKGVGTGYTLAIDAHGAAVLRLRAGDATTSLSGGVVNDGTWHHLIAEADRGAGCMTLYLDGTQVAQHTLELPAGASLANRDDFLVGKGARGNYFKGCIDFLRVSRGTLADAKTTIAELYAWEFDGPFLRDFCGAAPIGPRRDAGAIEVSQTD
jgi:hypothetical protein